MNAGDADRPAARVAAAPARGFDDAGLGQRLDEGELLVDCPAVVAGADRHGCKGYQRFLFIIFHEPYWNMEEGL